MDKNWEVHDHLKFGGKLRWGMERNIEGLETLMFGLGMFQINNGGAETVGLILQLCTWLSTPRDSKAAEIQALRVQPSHAPFKP